MKKKYSITIWKDGPRSKKFLLTDEKLKGLIIKFKEEDKPKSFEIWEVDKNGWKSLIYENRTEDQWYKNK